MIDITEFSVTPDPAVCGIDAVIRVVVVFNGGPRSVTVTVDLPGGCAFAPAPTATKRGPSSLAFTFTGRFSCPPGGRQLMLTARASGGGDSATNQTNVGVQC